MKKISTLFTGGILSLVALALFAFKLSDKAPVSKVDSQKAFAQTVITLDGEDKMLRELAGDKGTLVVFSCNTCPFVLAWEGRYNALNEVCKKNGVNMVLVNSNEAFRAKEDSHENMKKHAEKEGYTMPYVMDQNHAIADLLGAKTTPHVFLCNNNFEVVYEGAIDDNHKNAAEVQHTYAADAVKALAAGKEVSVAESKALGCSIKRVNK